MILLDTSVLIAAEKGALDLPARARERPDEEMRLAAITASEVLHGVHRADSGSRRARRERFVEQLFEHYPTLPFDLAVAREHARLWADLQAEGLLVSPHDLIIAATALYHDATVATRDLRSFPRIAALQVETWT